MTVVGLGLSLFFVGTDAPAATALDPVRGNILAALSGVTWALTVMGLRWMASREGDHGVVAVVIGNLVAFAFGLWQGWPVPPLGAVDVGVLLYLGVFQIGLAYLLVTTALRAVPAIEAAVLLLIEPACSPFWAWLVHRERPGGWAMLGGALILGATTLQTILASRRPGGAPPLEVIE